MLKVSIPPISHSNTNNNIIIFFGKFQITKIFNEIIEIYLILGIDY